MEQSQVDQLWNSIVTETGKRHKDTRSVHGFMRALRYGNNSRVFGQNKGLRKAVRNAPRKVALGALGFGMGVGAVPPGASDLVSAAAEVFCDNVKDLFSEHVKPLIRSSPAGDEIARKAVKSEVKDLKSNGLEVIDRNLVKLRAAKMDMEKKWGEFVRLPPDTAEEKQLEKITEALCAVGEYDYYLNKVTGLARLLRESMAKIQTNLDSLKKDCMIHKDSVSNYMVQNFD